VIIFTVFSVKGFHLMREFGLLWVLSTSMSKKEDLVPFSFFDSIDFFKSDFKVI